MKTPKNMHQNYIKYNIETPPKYPQSFTGKERDSETGFSYFGARYYDSDILTGWLSVDPMADKYPSLSPYAYCHWRPIVNIDYKGMFDDNYIIFWSGSIYKEETSDNINKYTFVNEDGSLVDLGEYNVEVNQYGENMVKVGEGAFGQNSVLSWAAINSGNLYFEEDAFAGLLGGIQDFYNTNSEENISKVQSNQFMSKDRKHSKKPNRNSSIDIAYYFKSGKPNAHTTNPNISDDLNNSLYNCLKKFGLGSTAVYTSIDKEGTAPYIKGTSKCSFHHHHMHLEGFNKYISSVVRIVGKKN